MSYYNADGLRILTDNDQGAVNNKGVSSDVDIKTLVVDVDLTADISPVANDPFIPAGAYITGGYVDVTEAITGATAFAIGLVESDGTTIDADGLEASSTLTAGLQKLGGALVDTKLANAGQVVASFTGTATASAFKLRVEYYI